MEGVGWFDHEDPKWLGKGRDPQNVSNERHPHRSICPFFGLLDGENKYQIDILIIDSNFGWWGWGSPFG